MRALEAVVWSWVLVACASVALMILTGCARTTETTHFIHYDPGGFVKEDVKTYLALPESINKIVIDGPCMSSCAFIYPADWRTCYTVNATLWFHPVSILGLVPTDETRALTESFLRRLPLSLAVEYQDRDPNIYPGTTLTYEDLKRVWPEGECQ